MALENTHGNFEELDLPLQHADGTIIPSAFYPCKRIQTSHQTAVDKLISGTHSSSHILHALLHNALGMMYPIIIQLLMNLGNNDENHTRMSSDYFRGRKLLMSVKFAIQMSYRR